MNTIVFLDDRRLPSQVINKPTLYRIIHVRDFGEFVRAIEQNDVDIVSYDHDLGCYDNHGNEITGYDCALWLLERCIRKDLLVPMYNIHSDNPAADKIGILLRKYAIQWIQDQTYPQ